MYNGLIVAGPNSLHIRHEHVYLAMAPEFSDASSQARTSVLKMRAQMCHHTRLSSAPLSGFDPLQVIPTP
eukprot:m.13468 g.13468  ORF g.13468 m.13468 type:complete len:70 (-) comp4665_c0_seq1:113-322(-)